MAVVSWMSTSSGIEPGTKGIDHWRPLSTRANPRWVKWMSIVLCMSLNEPSTFSRTAHSRPAPSFRSSTAMFGVLVLIAV